MTEIFRWPKDVKADLSITLTNLANTEWLMEYIGETGFTLLAVDHLEEKTAAHGIVLNDNTVIGIGEAGVDYTLTFNGENNDGVITWMEDEDYLKVDDHIFMYDAKQIYFRDTNSYVYSSSPSILAIVGATSISIYTTTVNIGKNIDEDTVVNFLGNTNDGTFSWMEDEDYFLIGDDLLMSVAEAIYFRDTSISISSVDDGHLDLMADVSIDLNTAANTDLVVNFFGTTNSGVLTWMEDEDYFQFSDGILVPVGEQVYFRDTAIYVYSDIDGWLNLAADTGVEVNAPVLNVATLYSAGAFSCNGQAVQTAYASGGALAGYVTGGFGLDSDAHMSALHAMVVKIRAALVANGIMS